MNTTKITPKSVIPMTQDRSAPIVDSHAINEASLSMSSSKPTMSSKQKIAAHSTSVNAGPGARCRVASLTPYGEKLNDLAMRALPAILGASDVAANTPGTVTRALLEQAIATPLRAKDIRTLPSTWPVTLISNLMVTEWASRLVAACDHVYSERGMQAYIEAVTDLIFDEGNSEGGLPSGVRDFCAMLTKNVLEIGVAQGLDRRSLQDLRNTVIIRFLMGSVFVPHLRPTAMRELTSDTTLYVFDRQLFKRFCHKTTEIIDIDAEAIALLAAARQSKQAAVA